MGTSVSSSGWPTQQGIGKLSQFIFNTCQLINLLTDHLSVMKEDMASNFRRAFFFAICIFTFWTASPAYAQDDTKKDITDLKSIVAQLTNQVSGKNRFTA